LKINDDVGDYVGASDDMNNKWWRRPWQQQFVPIPQNNERMLPSRPSSFIRINLFVEIYISHKNLGFSTTRPKGQTLKFHTPEFV
jgi:hypothetical protein